MTNQSSLLLTNNEQERKKPQIGRRPNKRSPLVGFDPRSAWSRNPPTWRSREEKPACRAVRVRRRWHQRAVGGRSRCRPPRLARGPRASGRLRRGRPGARVVRRCGLPRRQGEERRDDPAARRHGRAGGLPADLRVLRAGLRARLHDGVQPRRLRDVLRGHPHERHRDRREPPVSQAGCRRHHSSGRRALEHRRSSVAGRSSRRRRGRPERPRPRGDVQQHDQARAPADDDEARGRGGGGDGPRRGRRGRRSPRPAARQRRLRHRQPAAAHEAVQRRQLASGRVPACRRSS